MSQDLGNLLEGVRNRDRSSLARALSLLERYPDVARLLPRERGGHATVVAVAGPPGAGKSTLLGRVAAEITTGGYVGCCPRLRSGQPAFRRRPPR
jgi:LAO/AO transport system kinase